MTAATRSPASVDWRDLASLGEQLVSTTSLAAQRDRIIAMTRRLVDGDVDVWLREELFRLPDWEESPLFPLKPSSPGMQRALKGGTIQVQSKKGKNGTTRGTWAALPLEDQGVVMGALQVSRPAGPNFRQEEIDFLQGLAGVVAVSLLASHRVAVERFRLNQLNLVREVSAQIANVLHVDELARRVTELIQNTFKYYYVAIFTIPPGSKFLHFRSSAMAPRKGRRKASVALEVEIGQGLIGQAAVEGERIVCADVQKDPRYRFIHALPETRSEVVLPLKIEERVLGVLDIQSDQLNAFHPNDLLVLSALADTIARAVEGARLYTDLRRRANQLALIAEVSKSVNSTLDLTMLMRDVAKLIQDRFRYPHIHLFTVHPNRRLIEYEAGSGNRSRNLEGYNIPLDDPEGIIPWVAREGQTVLVNDVRKDARYRPSPLPPRTTRSELCVPLIYDQRVVGVLDIQSDRRNTFTEEDQMIFEAVADNIATAIHNADLYHSEQWRGQVAESLREVAGLLSANVGVDEVLEAILSELDRNLPVDISAIWLLDESELRLAACHNCDGVALENARVSSPDAALAMANALYSAEPLIRKPTDPIWASGFVAGFGRDYSALAAPLRVGDQPLGLITLAHHTSGRYGHEARAMTTTFASYAAVAIENARLYDAAQEQAYASAALLQVAQAVVSLNDLDEILEAIIRIMPILVGIDRVALYLLDHQNESFIPKQEFGLSDEEENTFWKRDFGRGSFSLLDATREAGQMLAFPIGSQSGLEAWLSIDPTQENVDRSSSERFLFTVPIAVKGDLYGVLLVEEAEGGVRFRSRRLEIITGIAQQAAIAIQNDLLQKEMVVRERLETEVQLARQIQQTFIPEVLPEHPNWQFAARWRTARQVGGDFYDVIELPDRRLGLFIADVADKGVPAALFMALTRTLVRAAVLETDSPAVALRRVNDLLIPDTKQGMFVTAVYAVLDTSSGELTYVNAGHNPPLWIKSNGNIERLTRTAVALGALEDAHMEQHTIQLEEGDSVLLYTDGLTEAFNNDGELFGEQRVLDALKSGRMHSAYHVLDSVERALIEFVEDMPPSDDLTMLAVRRT